MTTTTHIEASRRVLEFAAEGRLVQGEWHTEKDGRKMACFLGSMGNGVAIDSPDKCPGDAMHGWMAHLSVGLFDGMAMSDAIKWAVRIGTQMAHPRWLEVTGDDLRREFLIGTIEEALDYSRPMCSKEAYWEQVESACRQMQDALRGKGDMGAAESAAESAAWSAAESAARSAAWSAAESAARSAAESAVRSAARLSQANRLCDLIDARLA